MTKEELEKEAKESSKKAFCIAHTHEDELIYMNGYLASVEPREKRIAELEAQIEKMKCCMKCEHWYYYKSFCDKDNSYHSEGQSCEHFILRR